MRLPESVPRGCLGPRFRRTRAAIDNGSVKRERNQRSGPLRRYRQGVLAGCARVNRPNRTACSLAGSALSGET